MGREKSKKSHSSRKKSSQSSKKHKKRSDSSSEDDDRPAYIKDAETAHVAAEYVRCILRKFPAMKSELRDLLWRIDAGEGVRIDSLDDADTLRGIRGLMGSLNLHRSKTGTYSLKTGQDRILRRIGVVFSESIPDERNKPLRLPGDPATPPASPPVQPTDDAVPSSCEHASDQNLESHPLHSATESPGSVEGRENGKAGKGRILGPAAAPEELLQAAAEAAAAMRREGLLDDVMEGMSSDVVGPAPPPELVEQLTGASTDVREKQVKRIMALQAGGTVVDPYEILGVAEDAATSEIRKAFWKASLLVHPDKCKHSSAAAAFDAVKKAAEALMSSESRDTVDAGKRKEEENKMAAQVMQELERDRQWRIAQGTATEKDLRGKLGEPEVRDEWMTALPTKRAMKPAYMEQTSVNSFSSQGAQGGADDPSWTALPGQAPQLHIGYKGPMKKPQLPQDVIAEKNAELMKLARRQESKEQEPSKSLMEKHQQAQAERAAEDKRKARDQKRKREAATEGPVQQDKQAEWAGKSAWRPWDREKDLNIPKALNNSAPATSLASRFKPASS